MALFLGLYRRAPGAMPVVARAVPQLSSRGPRKSALGLHTSRLFTTTSGRLEAKKATDRGQMSDEGHEGSFARTDHLVRVEHPEDHEMPQSNFVQGRGGLHFKRTLAAFSLEGKVGVVTGGARGLGLVMSQALVVSGADVAIVDMNGESAALVATLALTCCRRGSAAAGCRAGGHVQG